MRIQCGRSSKKAGNPQFSKEDGKIVLTQFTDSIKKQVGGSICPEHGLHPTVKVKGSNFNKVEFEVSGCCQQVLDIVNKRLK
jgi:hypothetical protein